MVRGLFSWSLDSFHGPKTLFVVRRLFSWSTHRTLLRSTSSLPASVCWALIRRSHPRRPASAGLASSTSPSMARLTPGLTLVDFHVDGQRAAGLILVDSSSTASVPLDFLASTPRRRPACRWTFSSRFPNSRATPSLRRPTPSLRRLFKIMLGEVAVPATLLSQPHPVKRTDCPSTSTGSSIALVPRLGLYLAASTFPGQRHYSCQAYYAQYPITPGIALRNCTPAHSANHSQICKLEFHHPFVGLCC